MHQTPDTRPATLSPEALAERWNCSTNHLANRRSQGQGPAFLKPAGRVVYLLSDVEEYEAKTRVSAA